MTRLLVFGLLIGGLVLGPAWAADSSDSKTNHDVNQVKKDYEAKIHKDLKRIGAKIDRLKRDVERRGKTAGTDVHRQVKSLETQKADTNKKLVELEKSTGDAWKDLRQGVDEAVRNLKNAVDQAADQFKTQKG